MAVHVNANIFMKLSVNMQKKREIILSKIFVITKNTCFGMG